MSKTTIYRVQKVDEMIREGRYPDRNRLAEQLEVHVRTIQRDLDFMRDQLGAPIDFHLERKGYYYTSPNWVMPASPRLTEGDLFSLLIARQAVEQYRGTPLAKELDRIFSRIAGQMNDQIAFDTSVAAQFVSIAAPPAMAVDEHVWNAVLQGAHEQRVVQVQYCKPHARPSEARLCPYSIVNLQGEWYVLAGNPKDRDVKQYALGRIRSARVTNLDFKRPTDFKVGDWTSNAFGRFAHRDGIVEVKVRFSAEVEPWISSRVWQAKQVLKRNPDGSVLLTFKASGSGPKPFLNILSWILSFGAHAEVVAPEALRTRVREEIAMMHKKFGER